MMRISTKYLTDPYLRQYKPKGKLDTPKMPTTPDWQEIIQAVIDPGAFVLILAEIWFAMVMFC